MRPELLLTAASTPVSRYRRRILGLGFVLVLLLLGIGAPLYVQGIERDLERRVPDELAAAGVAGLTASFSGQEGVLRCPTPLSDPEAVLDRAHEIDGVTVVTLDRSCRVSSAPSVTTVPPPSPNGSDDTGQDGDDATTSDDDAAGPSSTEASFATVHELLGSGSRFSVLSTLAAEASLAEVLGGPGPVTLFAPDDEAFDALAADVLAELRNDPELLAEVLRHHVVSGAFQRADLDVGEIETLSGGNVTIARVGNAVTVEGAAVDDGDDGDLMADNGVVHGIDQVLLPEGLPLRSLAGLPEFVVVLGRGNLELSGAVAGDADRERLVEAATTDLDPANVVVAIEVEPATGLTGGALDAVLELVTVLPATLTGGSISFDGSDVSVRGTVLDDDARAVLDDIAARRSVTMELSPRPVADTDDARELQAELGAFLAESPIEFAPNSADLLDGAQAHLDVLAAMVKRFDGLLVLVEGHTDTAGNPQTNLDLSEFRAAVVYLGLIQRGVPDDQLDFVGRGGESPVVVGGVEDAAASRRVELVVERVE